MNWLARPILALPLLYLAACATAPAAPPPTVPPPPPVSPVDATRVLDQAALQRLLANKGVTLQWLGWDQRGSVNARMEGGVLRLTAAQAKNEGGRLLMDGAVREIGSDYFVFSGFIRITDTPDAGRYCEQSKEWRFAVTQNRPYWRLREFEWCDGLTDYIDIYF